jgi:hypothetical protein
MCDTSIFVYSKWNRVTNQSSNIIRSGEAPILATAMQLSLSETFLVQESAGLF